MKLLQIALVPVFGVIYWVCVSALRLGSPDAIGLLGWFAAAGAGALISEIVG